MVLRHILKTFKNLLKKNKYSLIKLKIIMKRIFDPIYGDISIETDIIQIIDTLEFKRLKNIKQLGLTHHVFPSATFQSQYLLVALNDRARYPPFACDRIRRRR